MSRILDGGNEMNCMNQSVGRFSLWSITYHVSRIMPQNRRTIVPPIDHTNHLLRINHPHVYSYQSIVIGSLYTHDSTTIAYSIGNFTRLVIYKFTAFLEGIKIWNVPQSAIIHEPIRYCCETG